MTLLSWSVIEYKEKYQAAGELTHIKELIKWGTDYMLKTFNYTSPNVAYVFAQVCLNIPVQLTRTSNLVFRFAIRSVKGRINWY